MTACTDPTTPGRHRYRFRTVHDLAGQNNAWLKSACRERQIRGFSSMNRTQLQQALLAWFTDHPTGG